MYERVLELAKTAGELWSLAAYGNLGNIYFTRGDLDRAEEIYRQALETDDQFGKRKGMAQNHDNLGMIFKERSKLNKAKDHWS